jgi:hypothetical protein
MTGDWVPSDMSLGQFMLGYLRLMVLQGRREMDLANHADDLFGSTKIDHPASVMR